MGKLSIAVVKFYNDGAVQVLIRICELRFDIHVNGILKLCSQRIYLLKLLQR